MNWKIVKLKGNSSLDFNIQLRKLNQEFLSKKWQMKEILKLEILHTKNLQ